MSWERASWWQFPADFDGDFRIGDVPLLLGPFVRHEGQTGDMVWDAAVALTKVLECNKFLVEGRAVLELGAGRGLVGICAAMLGAGHVTLTDLPYALPQLSEALELNGFGPTGSGYDRAQTAELDWFQPDVFVERRPEQGYDVVLGADIIWRPELTRPLAATLGVICKQSPTAEVIVCYQSRLVEVIATFLEAMDEEAFEIIWEVKGGDSPVWSVGHPGMVVKDGRVRWHKDYTPDARINLWCFRKRVREDHGRLGAYDGPGRPKLRRWLPTQSCTIF